MVETDHAEALAASRDGGDRPRRSFGASRDGGDRPRRSFGGFPRWRRQTPQKFWRLPVTEVTDHTEVLVASRDGGDRPRRSFGGFPRWW
jgi:hypothetical protein